MLNKKIIASAKSTSHNNCHDLPSALRTSEHVASLQASCMHCAWDWHHQSRCSPSQDAWYNITWAFLFWSWSHMNRIFHTHTHSPHWDIFVQCIVTHLHCLKESLLIQHQQVTKWDVHFKIYTISFISSYIYHENILLLNIWYLPPAFMQRYYGTWIWGIYVQDIIVAPMVAEAEPSFQCYHL